jgi:hypothetical protein
MESEYHDLHDFMSSVTKEMADDYNRIQKRVKEDPGTAGDQGEENWAALLRDWLPPIYQVVTKGRILSHAGITSPQLDVLVLKPTYPKKLLEKKIYLAGGVAAAFECKIKLEKQHIDATTDNAAKIRKNFQSRIGSPYKELNSSIIYGLLAHSHEWKRPKSKPIETITKNLLKADLEKIQHPREMLDLVCVADLACWTSIKTAWIGPSMVPNWSGLEQFYGSQGSATTAYVCHSKEVDNQKPSFRPIGTMISYLLQKLAWEDDSLRDLARYFVDVGISGLGQGQMRLWQADIYSEQIRNSVVSGLLLSGVENFWNEWLITFS